MILIVLMPDQRQVQLNVADDVLVFDGIDFVDPARLKYVSLYTMPVESFSLPFDDLVSQRLTTAARVIARVLNRFVYPGLPDSPELETAPIPSPGQCTCFITCKGTDLRFVQVHTEA